MCLDPPKLTGISIIAEMLNIVHEMIKRNEVFPGMMGISQVSNDHPSPTPRYSLNQPRACKHTEMYDNVF